MRTAAPYLLGLALVLCLAASPAAALPQDCDEVCDGTNPDRVCAIPGTTQVIRCSQWLWLLPFPEPLFQSSPLAPASPLAEHLVVVPEPLPSGSEAATGLVIVPEPLPSRS